MSRAKPLTQRRAAELAREIRECKADAAAYVAAHGGSEFPFFAGALQSILPRLVRELAGNLAGDEVLAAMEDSPSVAEIQAAQARHQAFTEQHATWKSERQQTSAEGVSA